MPPLPVTTSTGLTITNPLILYRSLLATKQIDPDPAQHRLALHLQKLYNRLKDYSPQVEYGTRLKAISDAIGEERERDEIGANVAVPGHPLRRNPLFAHLFARKEDKSTRALTRVLTSHEAAMELQSPKGLLLHGEVGTGKSMLLDLLADSLPNKMKARWHFNTFMLETLSKLESLRKSRLAVQNLETEYSLLWLAKDMIEKSPILFLDEFQLPDRAASKILNNLFTTFFLLGGVLIASSNRMPEELAKASGVEFIPPPRVGLVRNIFGIGAGNKQKGALADPGKGEFAGFLEVLKARCEVWEMEGGKDWRRRETELLPETQEMESLRESMIEEGFEGLHKLSPGNLGLGFEQSPSNVSEDRPSKSNVVSPKNYLLTSLDSEETWNDIILKALPAGTPMPVPWKSMDLIIYGRTVQVTSELADVALWTFSNLCGGSYGPADYITLASTFHTVILDQVPVLTISQKNEARRLITLLDALYEARCKLIIRADAGPDDLFFPETAAVPGTARDENDDDDAVYPETMSEIYQDQTSPFRPNVSAYDGQNPIKSGYDPDEDSDLGPLAGKPIDFGQTSTFIGEDERFAYKRARSRLWEMCGHRWHARKEEGWWKPLPLEVRRWEQPTTSTNRNLVTGKVIEGDVQMGPAFELDAPAGLQGKELEAKKAGLLEGKKNPWLQEKEAEKTQPSMGWTPWGMVSWARRNPKS